MPFPLNEVFSPVQQRYLPKGMDTLEDVALASPQEFAIKQGWRYVDSARRYLAKNLIERIWRDGDCFFVKAKENIFYPDDYEVGLYRALAVPFVGVYYESRISFTEKNGGTYRYQVKFENEYERQSFEKFSSISFRELVAPAREEHAQSTEIPDDLFDSIVGYEEAKRLFDRSLRSEKPVHILLIGPPASAKTVFLLEIERLRGAAYALGGSSSKAGLAELLFNRMPSYLLVDELDKMDAADYTVLLSLSEEGRVSEVKYGKLRETRLNTRVYAAANSIERIPKEVQSRFLSLTFPPYTADQYREVVRNVLIKRERVEEELANYIAQKVSKELETVDVRDSIKVSRLAKTKEDVDTVLASISKYR